MLIEFIEKWGYIALFVGSLIEGESIVLTISSMSYFGKFSLAKVMFVAFLGTFLADQLFFYIGRMMGSKILIKYPYFNLKAEKILFLLEKYDVPFILGFRFIYGIRILSPFFIGMSKIANLKFVVLNFFSAIIWSVLSSLLGYYIGMFSSVLGHDSYRFVFIFNLLIMLLIVLLFHFISKKFAKKM